MSISLKVGQATQALPDDLLWTDELAWRPVRQSEERSLTGALILSAQALVAGRPITLAAPGGEGAWITRAEVDQLQIWAAQPGLVLTLDLRGVQRSVVFRHQDAPALEAHPVLHYSDVLPGDPYTITIKLQEV